MKVKGTQTTTSVVEVTIGTAQQLAIVKEQDPLTVFNILKEQVIDNYCLFLAERLHPQVAAKHKDFFVRDGWLYALDYDYDYHNNCMDDWRMSELSAPQRMHYKQVEQQLEAVEYLLSNFTNRKHPNENQ